MHMRASSGRVAVVGAGVGGLSAAIDLASKGAEVTVFEAREGVGGKMRQIPVGRSAVDAGPTVLTMRWVFDELFEASGGARFEDYVRLVPLDILARHAFPDGTTLDLHADEMKSEAAIEAFAGRAELERYRAFRAYAKNIFSVAEGPFVRSEKPTLGSLWGTLVDTGLFALSRVDGHRTMWKALRAHLKDPRLVQLYGRYATYCGASPFECPATLNLVSAVEAMGVHVVDGGMQNLSAGLERRARELGVSFRFGQKVDRVETRGGRARGVIVGGEAFEADAVVVNADVAAVGKNLLGPLGLVGEDVPLEGRSFSAFTLSVVGKARGIETTPHNVFFSDDYPAEFDDLVDRLRTPESPTVYVCDQGPAEEPGLRKFLVVTNAPATGDRPERWSEQEISRCRAATYETLERCGLSLSPEAEAVTTPVDFERIFPGTGGALYGRRPTGPLSFFQRPGSRSKVPGLYFAGGSVHPGPGVPMVASSGRLAARSVREDLASTARSSRAVISGFTSTG